MNTAIKTYSPELQAVRHEVLMRCMGLDLEPKVLGDGDLTAEIAIIGQGPGAQEVMGKSPFVGPTGKLLWDTLRQHGLLRTQCYVTNVCKRQFSIDKKADLGKDEWLKWQTIVDYELTQMPNLKYVFALGNAALQLFTGNTGIEAYRGSVMPATIKYDDGSTREIQVLYSYNPANIFRAPQTEIIFQMDARRLGQLVKGDFEEWPVDTRFNFTFKEALAEIVRFKAENKPTSFDLELSSGELACVGMANELHKASCINFRGQLENLYTLEEEIELMFALQDLYQFLAENNNVIVQNGAFDSGFHGIKDWVDMPVSYDTMLMHHTLYPSLPHNLGFLTAQYTTIPYYKEEFDRWKDDGDVEILWNYNGKDCCATLAAFYKMKDELIAQKLWVFYNDHVKRGQMHAIRSTIAGIATDLTMREQVSSELKAKVEAALQHFVDLIDSTFPPHKEPNGRPYRPNPGSWQQLQKLFYEPKRLGLKDSKKGTDEATRTALLKDPRTGVEAKEILTAINVFKSLAKFAGTYVDLRLDKDNRFRCVWKQEGVTSAPGRLSSSATLWGTGMNGQNQPPEARKFFVADEGCCFIYFDLKQAEAQVVAYRADIPKWKEDFARTWEDDSFDCHRSLASDIFKIPYDDVPKSDRNEDDTDYTIRYTSKRARHGLNYRMQIATFAEQAGISFSRAAQTYHLYHKMNPEIQKWWKEQEYRIKKDREIWNALGRRWKPLRRLEETDALDALIAFYPQSTIGDKVFQVWYQSEEDDRWDNHKARVVLDIHDALIAVSTLDFAKTALSIMKAYAQTPMLIENVYGTKRELLRIGADTAMSTLDLRDKKTKQIIGVDKYHRWSGLEKMKVEPAYLAAA